MTDAPVAVARFPERVSERISRTGSMLCLGLDPHPDALPAGFERDLRGIEAFSRLLIEAAAPLASAVKANLAFFEAFGPDGLRVLGRLRDLLPLDLPFIADAKRGDIETTSMRHAVALFDQLRADAVTASPYLGRAAIAPLLEHPDGFVYVLCRTSNPGAGEFQALLVSPPAGAVPASGAEHRAATPEPLYLHIARSVAAWAGGGEGVGLVVGATAPDELAKVRAAVPATPILVPGVGRQGGGLDAVRRHAPVTAGPGAATRGGRALVNVSRAIAEAAAGDVPDPLAALRQAAEVRAAELRV